MVTRTTTSPAAVRAALLNREEIALLDVREEDPYAQAHPLWAANLPLSKLELEAWGRLPRRDVPVVVYDDGEGLAEPAAERLRALGYRRVSLLEGGLAGWRAAGYELFRDVNVPSKSFGELVEHELHTPSLAAEDLQALIDARANVVVLDARRYDEYHTMNIPGSTSLPGGELVLRARELAPDPATRVIVNCAGRTRSIIGTQSLVNAGLPNPVAALRNGTIGWTLAGQALEHGAERRAPARLDPQRLGEARAAAVDVARRAGVLWLSADALEAWLADPGRTTYLGDVRTPEEYAAGHVAGFRSMPGGQLVQETDHHAPVRGARFVLVDDDGVRAPMTASWLAQMGWQVAVLQADAAAALPVETGPDRAEQPEPPAVRTVTPATLADWLATGAAVLLDLTASANYVKRHVPGAWWALRSQLAAALARADAGEASRGTAAGAGDAGRATAPAVGPDGVGGAGSAMAAGGGAAAGAAPTQVRRVVLTCGSSLLARHAAADIRAAVEAAGRELWVLEGGTAAWIDAGLPLEHGETRLASPRIDRYRRPYEGTDNARAAMQAYLDWEFSLVEQLGRDGTHHFHVL